MDRKYPIESLLLSRSYDSKAKVLELLEQRYALNDKPTLSLRPTTATEDSIDKSSLLTRLKNEKIKHQKHRSKDKTKVVFKNFIKRNKILQRIIKNKLQKLKREQPDVKHDVTKFKEWSKISHYEDYLKLNRLWIGYIQDLLLIENGKFPTNAQIILTKLAAAEFNGCFIRVIKSSNKNVVGKHGIVIWDSKNYFIIAEAREEDNVESIGGLKLVEKKNTVFNFMVPLYDIDSVIDDNDDEYLEFSIIGSRFQYRSADRSGRKFKSRNVDDLDI